MRIAVYPGTFDPVTNGHLDLVNRASQIFDKVIIAVSNNPHKNPLFSIEERRDLIFRVVQGMDNVEVDMFDGLLVSYAQKKGACALIRGLRAVSDFEYEFQMALMNRKLQPDLETVYLMPSEEYTYINSTISKEIARFGGDISCFVPGPVIDALKEKFSALNNKEKE